MTSRARRLLDALEDGCQTRGEFYRHAGRYFIVNNAASELRRAGVDVAWDHATDTYKLLGDRPARSPGRTAAPPCLAAVSVTEDTQLTLNA